MPSKRPLNTFDEYIWLSEVPPTGELAYVYAVLPSSWSYDVRSAGVAEIHARDGRVRTCTESVTLLPYRERQSWTSDRLGVSSEWPSVE
jgi:hypothetical protein